MGKKKITRSGFRGVWGWSLLTGLGTSILSLMLGLLLQMTFYEVASSLPSVIRQDAHIGLPLCNSFPDMYGCEPGVGKLTGLEIWELSNRVGEISGLSLNVILMLFFSMRATVRVRSGGALPGLLTGIAGLCGSLVLALVFNVPLNVLSLRGIFGILMLLLLPLGGWMGGRMGMDRLARQPSHGAAVFLPVEEAQHLERRGETLSKRELEILSLVAEGLQNQDIARRLHISKATVKTHLIHIYGKLHVDNRTAAVMQALAVGLLRKEGDTEPV